MIKIKATEEIFERFIDEYNGCSFYALRCKPFLVSGYNLITYEKKKNEWLMAIYNEKTLKLIVSKHYEKESPVIVGVLLKKLIWSEDERN